MVLTPGRPSRSNIPEGTRTISLGGSVTLAINVPPEAIGHRAHPDQYQGESRAGEGGVRLNRELTDQEGVHRSARRRAAKAEDAWLVGDKLDGRFLVGMDLHLLP